MTRQEQKGMDPTQFMDEVVKNSTRFWEGMAGFSWPSQEVLSGKSGAGGDSASFNPWEPAMEAWKQFQESCSPEILADPFQTVREEGFKQFEKMARGGWDNLFSMGDGFPSSMRWGQFPFGLTASDLFGGKDTFKELFKVMTGELNRFIAIPPVGISRNYQERMVNVVEKGNQFLLTVAEYMFLMFSPLEQAMQMVLGSVKELTEEQRRSLTPEAVYDTWLKELEQGYFTLYGSQEYLELLKRLVSAMGEFNLARQNFMSDCLKLMGIPSENDLDDLYRDLYTLKKKLSSIENTVDSMAQSAGERPVAETVETLRKVAPAEVKPAEKAEAASKEEAKAAKAAEKPAQPKAVKSADKAPKTTKQTAKPAGKTA